MNLRPSAEAPGYPRSASPVSTGAAGARTGWLLDSHVHLYPCFELRRFLDATVANFAAASDRLSLASGSLGCVVLTESGGFGYFERLRDGSLRIPQHDWNVAPTAEASSLLITTDGDPKLVMIAGRQIRTREDLEVLALGCTAVIPDGQSMADTLAQAEGQSMAVVLPWGVGKWWLRRGRVIADALNRAAATEKLFVGDNANRARPIPLPRLFALAAARGIRILPGSDPLPLTFHESRAGRSGVFLPCDPDTEAPTRQIGGLLRQHRTQPERFDGPEPLSRFLRAQALMQMRKRARYRGHAGGTPTAGEP